MPSRQLRLVTFTNSFTTLLPALGRRGIERADGQARLLENWWTCAVI
jgi:hypothetical protein